MKHIPNLFFKIFLVVLALLSAASIYLWHSKNLRYYSVQSNSMVPTLNVGDLVINEKSQFATLKQGDIISYVSPLDQRLIITHRIVSKDIQKGTITTRGDNIVSPDTPITDSSIQGRTIFSIPYLGYILDALRNPIGLVIIIYTPVLILAIAEVKHLINKLNKPYKHANFS